MQSSIRSNDSSVVFNLRQLMQLEDERVRADEAAREAAERETAERERRAHAEALRAEAERQAALQRMRIEAEAAERAETERQATLLRVRLEVEAAAHAERLARERLVVEPPPAPRRSPALLIASAAAIALVLGAAVALGFARPTAPAAVGVSSQELLAGQARELAELRRRIGELSALATAAPAISAPASVPSAAPKTSGSTRKPGRNHRDTVQRRIIGNELDELDVRGDDPITDL